MSSVNFRLALVTGATSGLGEELSSLLSQKNIPLLLTGRDEKRLKEAALRFHAGSMPLDLRQDRGPLLSWIRENKPDLVINCAGFGLYGPVLIHDKQSQIDLLEVNAAAAMEISIEVAKALLASEMEGTILNVSSVAGELSIPMMAVYAASKAFITSFSRSFDAEMKPFRIRILASLPGPIATPFAQRASFGRFTDRPSFTTLTPARAAQLIWRQIETKKSTQIIGFSMRAILALTQLIPRALVERVLQNNLAKRYTPSP